MDKKQANPVDKQPIPVKGMGYPNDAKTKGVETRGNGAAIKGRKAYGPLA